jgi:hypothetical protein
MEILDNHSESEPEDPLTKYYQLLKEDLEKRAETNELVRIECANGNAYIKKDAGGRDHIEAVINKKSGVVIYPNDIVEFTTEGNLAPYKARATPFIDANKKIIYFEVGNNLNKRGLDRADFRARGYNLLSFKCINIDAQNFVYKT